MRQTQWSRWPPNTGLNINMAWVWLRKERDPVYLWTCLCLGHNYRKIDRGDEGQRKRVEKQCVLTCGFFQYGQTVQSDPPTQKLDISVCLYASLAVHIHAYHSALSTDAVQCANYKVKYLFKPGGKSNSSLI